MEYNTTTVFHTRKNNYNSSPIELANKIYQSCLKNEPILLNLLSGKSLKQEDGYCLKIITKKIIKIPTQMEILFFLGNNSSYMKEPDTILKADKIPNDSWLFTLCKCQKTSCKQAN